MRLISTDFDGVMHPVSAINGLSVDGFLSAGWKHIAAARGLFRWRVMLEHLLSGHSDVQLIVHSSWRMYICDSMLRELLGECLARHFVGITSIHLGRREGIEAFAEQVGAEHLLVIDDDLRPFGKFDPLLLLDPELGLSVLKPMAASGVGSKKPAMRQTRPSSSHPPRHCPLPNLSVGAPN